MQGITPISKEVVKEPKVEAKIAPVQKSIGEVDREVRDREEEELRRFRAD